jgi:hypothetical protein
MTLPNLLNLHSYAEQLFTPLAKQYPCRTGCGELVSRPQAYCRTCYTEHKGDELGAHEPSNEDGNE